MRYLFALIFGCTSVFATAQYRPPQENMLFTAGHAGAFVAGLYDAFYPYEKLMAHGNFGLGAPDKLDGELMFLNGHIYQTQASGKTFEIAAKGELPFAVVNFFKADKVVSLNEEMTKDQFFAYLDKLLPEVNGMYAIHIKGDFNLVKTRAFPKVTQQPYLPLAAMLDRQQFFTLNAVGGDFVGYRLPAYMDGPNITGYHFHFISTDKKMGGHVVDFTVKNIVIEIDILTGFTVEVPQTSAFNEFDFRKDRSAEIKQVENGKKNR